MFKYKKLAYQLLGILLATATFIWLAIFSQTQSGVLEVNFFDVGQGDAIFIKTPEGHQILIDGGPDAIILEKLGKELSFDDKDIDLVILTHSDADHLNGLIEVLRYYQIGQILENGVQKDTATYREWQGLIAEKNIPVKIARAGQVVDLGRNVKLKILWPEQSFVDSLSGSHNNASIVAQLLYGQSEFLLTGDIEKQVELILATNLSTQELESDILKIAHHGSKTSTRQSFLEKVSPEIAVISLGKNSYGHPHREVLEKLKNIKLYRTDDDGDVEIKTNGQWFGVKKEKQR